MGRGHRRQPQRVPLTRDIGNTGRIRAIVDDQHYMVDVGSRIGTPIIAFYIGSLVLVPGERVLLTWRSESMLWSIDGPIRQPGVTFPGVIGVGFQEVAGGSGQFVQVIGSAADGSLGTPIADPAILPTATVERIKWSHNGQWVAIAYDDQLSIYEWAGAAWGPRLANVTLPDGAAASVRLGLDWNVDDTLLAVAHDDAATTEGLTILTWDGATLTEAHNEVLDGFLENSGTACVWHPTDPNRVFVAVGTTAFSVFMAFDWDGSSLTEIDQLNVTGFTVDMEFRPGGDKWIGCAAITSRILAMPWDNDVPEFGTLVQPSTLPANSTSEGVAWSRDGSKIVVANGSVDIVGYTFDGSFGARVTGAMPGVGPVANGIAGHPIDNDLFGIALETASAGGIYLATMTFDGTAWATVDSLESVGAEHFDGISVGFPPGSPIIPTEQLDASEVTYTPADATDWDVEPDDVAEALDELADRVSDIGLGRLDLPLGSFVAHTASPAYAQVGTNLYAWALDDTVDELIAYGFTVPPDYGSAGFFRLTYAMASATSGDIVASVNALSVEEGDDFDAAGVAATIVDTVQGVTATNLGIVDLTPVVTYVRNARARVVLGRLGSDGSDGATGDMWLVGAEFRYTPDA